MGRRERGRKEKTYLDVTIGELGGKDEGSVGDTDAVVGFITFLETTKDRDSGGHGGFPDEDGLEAAFEGGVFLHVLTVLLQRRGPNTAELSSCQHGLQKISSVHRSIRTTRA